MCPWVPSHFFCDFPSSEKGATGCRGKADCVELAGDFRGSRSSENRALHPERPSPLALQARGERIAYLFVGSTARLAFCNLPVWPLRSRESRAPERNTVPLSLKIGMYAVVVSFGPVPFVDILGSNWRVELEIRGYYYFVDFCNSRAQQETKL